MRCRSQKVAEIEEIILKSIRDISSLKILSKFIIEDFVDILIFNMLEHCSKIFIMSAPILIKTNFHSVIILSRGNEVD